VFRTTEEDLSGTTATKGKVAEIATESMTTFDRILIGAQEVRATPGNDLGMRSPGRSPSNGDPIGLHSGNRLRNLFVLYNNHVMPVVIMMVAVLGMHHHHISLVLKTEMTDAPDCSGGVK
jgi:hypothetical protein